MPSTICAAAPIPAGARGLQYLRYYKRKLLHAGCGALTPMKKLERAA